MTSEEQAKNAIKWIDELPDYKQAKKGSRGKLGDADNGYCCLGVGCVLNKIEFEKGEGYNLSFRSRVGLKYHMGEFGDEHIDGFHSLAHMNDDSDHGFIGIQATLQGHPSVMFHPTVATLITKHYKTA